MEEFDRDIESELEFIELSSIRHVRTPEGAEYYDLPIGAPITADIIKQKRIEKGTKPPKGALTSNSAHVGKSTTGGSSSPIKSAPNVTPYNSPAAKKPNSVPNPSLPHTEPSKGKKPKKPKAHPSTLKGPNQFSAGRKHYYAPNGARIFRPKAKSDVAFVLEDNGNLHAFNAEGEVDLPEPLHSQLVNVFKNLDKNDPVYVEEKFEKKAKLSSYKPGTTLSKDGEVLFVRTDDGKWENERLGIILEDKDVQNAVDNGDYTVDEEPADIRESESPKEKPLKDLTQKELKQKLDSYPAGQELYYADSDSHIQKLENGNWVSGGKSDEHDSTSVAKIFSSLDISEKSPEKSDESSEDSKKEEEAPSRDDFSDISEEVKQLLESGKKLAAVKQYKKEHQTGVFEAKDRIDSYEKSEEHQSSLKSLQPKDGEHVISVDQLKAMPPGSKITIDDSMGMAPAVYTKEDDGKFYEISDKSHFPIEAENFDEDINDGIIEFGDATGKIKSPHQTTKHPGIPENAKKLTDQYDLKDYDEVYVERPDGGVSHLKRNTSPGYDGDWVSDDGVFFFTDSDLNDDIIDGTAYGVKSAEEKSPEPEPSLTTEEKNSAIEALENHSGFQVVYGLKSLPDNHPLKNEETLQREMKAAKAEFPEKSPKQALISHLKGQQNPEESLADWEKALLEPDVSSSNSKKIQIGSKDSKSTQTGLTGGSFSEEDVKDAIDILENFNGKVFKSELNKKGNPLGQLSPNHIVGFNKDKTVTKQKFLDLLKSKISTNKPVDFKKIDIEEDLSSDDLFKALNDAKPGTKLYLPGGNSLIKGDGSSTEWVQSNTNSIHTSQAIVAIKDKLSAHPFRSTPGKSVPDVAHLENIPYGTMLHHQDSDDHASILKSLGNSTFEDLDTGDAIDSSDLILDMKDGKVTYYATEEKKTDFVVGQKIRTVEELRSLESGTSVSSGFSTYTKQDGGKFKSSSTGVSYSTSAFSGAISSGNLHISELPNSKDTDLSSKSPDEPLTVEEFNGLKPGSVVKYQGKFGNKALYFKNSDGTWSYIDGSKIVNKEMQPTFGPALKNGNMYIASPEEVPKLDLPETEKEETKKPIVYKVLKEEEFSNLPDGSTVAVHHIENGTIIGIYRKKSNKWLLQGSDTTIAATGYIKKKAANGQLELIPSNPELKKGDKLTPDNFSAAHASVGTKIKNAFGTSFVKEDENVWRQLDEDGLPNTEFLSNDADIDNDIDIYSSDLGTYNYSLVSTGEEPGIDSTSASGVYHVGDSVTVLDDKLRPGDILTLQTPGSPSLDLDIQKIGVNAWSFYGASNPTIFEDQNITSLVEKGRTLRFKGHEDLPEGASAGGSSKSFNSGEIDHGIVKSGGDSSFKILPEGERGESGDGFVIVHTDSGPILNWGKYGGGGVAVTAMRDGKRVVLVGRRGDRNQWYLPGGAIEEKETGVQGALREFAEEIDGGLDLIGKFDVKGLHTSNIGKIDGSDRDWVYTTMHADIGDAVDVRAPELGSDAHADLWEIQHYEWMDESQLEDLDRSGKLLGALSNGNLAKIVGFESGKVDQKVDGFKDLGPKNLSEIKYDISRMKKVGGSQGGSNAGGIYEDDLGNKFYVKSPNGGTGAVHNEVLAGALYSALGVNSNEVHLGSNGTNPELLVVTPWIDGLDEKALPNALSSNSEFLDKVREDFVVDAWLGNYDVTGTNPYNIVADDMGNPLRLDPGGSMLFRATGGKKDWWGDNPTDIDDMRFGSSHSSAYSVASQVFGSMSEDDVKESAKKLLGIRSEQIRELVGSTGFDDETKDKLAQTLVNRRNAILSRYGLRSDDSRTSDGLIVSSDVKKALSTNFIEAANKFAADNNISYPEASSKLITWENYEKTPSDIVSEAPEKFTQTAPKFDKGTEVVVKGTGDKLSVELSTNEASAGIVDGKYRVFLNDEIDLPGTTHSLNYAFTSDGQEFDRGEEVLVPDPHGSNSMVNATIVSADWNSGQVTLSRYDENFQTDKTHILKNNGVDRTLTSSYATVPSTHRPVLMDSKSKTVYVQDPDGNVYAYTTEGKTKFMDVPANDVDYWKKNPNLVPFDRMGLGQNSTPSAPSVDSEDSDEIKVGDVITVVKQNKKGASPYGKVLKIGDDGKATIQRLTESGAPVFDENGKKVTSKLDVKNLQKKKNLSGLPTGVSKSESDPDSPLYGTPTPARPKTPNPADSIQLSDDFYERANAALQVYRENKGYSPKTLEESSVGKRLDKALLGDQQELDYIEYTGYFKSDPSIMEEIKENLSTMKSTHAKIMADHLKAVEEYRIKHKEWLEANGIYYYTPLDPSTVPGLSKKDAISWASKTLSPKWENVSETTGFQTQKIGGWQDTLRLLPATVGLDRESVAEHASSHQMETWDSILKGTEQAGPVGEAFKGIRSVDMRRFVKNDGSRFTTEDDLKEMIGSIQKDHGAMEFSPGSWDEGAHSGYDAYEVEVDLTVPPELKAVYTEGNPDLSHTGAGEYGIITQPGLAMYIWDVFQDPNQSKVDYQGKGRWIVRASLISPDVYPYMNNFEGDPDSHNIYIPGVDTSAPTPDPEPEKVIDENAGKWTEDELNALYPGHTVVDSSEVEWTKTANSSWVNKKGVHLYPEQLADYYMEDSDDSNLSDSVPTPSQNFWDGSGSPESAKNLSDLADDSWSTEFLTKAPAGAMLKVGEKYWRKDVFGQWSSTSSLLGPLSSSEFSTYLKQHL